jgi:hypothetical protein
MSLNVWDQLSDPYDHNQLANNWAKVDQHDHSSGKGLQVPTAGIQDGAVTAAKLAPGAIPTFSIPDGSITKAKLAPGVLDVTNFGTFPSARVTNNADQTFLAGSSGWATVGFNTVNFDPNGMHTSPSSPNVTCQAAGLYLITSTVAISQPDPFYYYNWSWNNAIQTRIILNGGNAIAQSSQATTANTFWYREWARGTVVATITTVYRLNVSDYVTVQAAINTGTYYFTVPALPNYSPTLSVAWIGN